MIVFLLAIYITLTNIAIYYINNYALSYYVIKIVGKPINNKCIENTDYLKSISDISDEIPQIIDLYGYQDNGNLIIEGIINNHHLPPDSNHFGNQYTLIFNNNTYPNLEKRNFQKNTFHTFLRFNLYQITNRKRLLVTLMERTHGTIYKIPVCIIKNEKKGNIAQCAYIDKRVNSIDQIVYWISFNKIVGVDHIYLYLSTPYIELNKVLKQDLRNNYVTLIDFTWKRYKRHGMIQQDNQQTQMNHCFYKHRLFYKSFLLGDIDELFYSKENPLCLYCSLRIFYNNKTNALTILSQFITNEDGNLKGIEQALHDGNVLDVYKYRATYHESGRVKVIVFDTFNGFIVNHATHYAVNHSIVCPSTMAIIHMKKNVNKKHVMLETNLFNYTRKIQQVMQLYY